MKYLSIINGSIGFKTSEIHEILTTDVPISDDIYNRFFSEQSSGKQFRIKNINGTTFESIFEEYIPEVSTTGDLSIEQRTRLLERAMDDLLLGGGL